MALTPHSTVQEFLCAELGCEKRGFAKSVRQFVKSIDADAGDILHGCVVIPDAYKIQPEFGVVEVVEVEDQWPLSAAKRRAYATLQWELNAWEIKLHVYTLDMSLFWSEVDLDPILGECVSRAYGRLQCS